MRGDRRPAAAEDRSRPFLNSTFFILNSKPDPPNPLEKGDPEYFEVQD
jgi:hypothetical protein